MKARLAVLSAVLLFSYRATAQLKTITIGDDYTVTFDPSRVSQAELMHWLRLSPTPDVVSNYLFPRSLDTCIEEDATPKKAGNESTALDYQDCDKHRDVPSVHNAKVNIAIAEKVLHDLDTYPSDLSEVVAYARRFQEFGVWINQSMLEYLETGNASSLEESYGDIDLRGACSHIVAQVRNAKSTKEGWRIVKYDWQNCVLGAARKGLGEYPQKAWDDFLAGRGIIEKTGEPDD